MLEIGKDLKKNQAVQIDDTHSRAILICGKRGSGKSYTLGVIAEELFSSVSKPLILVIDPIGIYWTMCLANPQTDRKEGLPVKVIIPGKPQARYGPDVTNQMQKLGVEFQEVRINPYDLSPDQWCDLFDLSINEPLGIALYRAIQHLKKKSFSIPDIIDAIQKDPLAQDKTREALLNRLEMACDWDIFNLKPQGPLDILSQDQLNILDLSVIDPGTHGLRNLIVSIFCQDLFKKRAQARRREELNLGSHIKRIWLLIDEAHQFVPQGKQTLAKEVLIRWIKEGRQPGLSCVFASQQPSSLENEVITQCDIIICHKLTNNDDILAVNKLSQDYMGSELRVYIRNLKNIGEAVLVDDEKERVSMIKIRKRLTKHGGEELQQQ
jgi:DNA helicase HerA-like ATPase